MNRKIFVSICSMSLGIVLSLNISAAPPMDGLRDIKLIGPAPEARSVLPRGTRISAPYGAYTAIDLTSKRTVLVTGALSFKLTPGADAEGVAARYGLDNLRKSTGSGNSFAQTKDVGSMESLLSAMRADPDLERVNPIVVDSPFILR
ncbi:MAG: hypothetical protein VW684_07665 [Betaproteobacteria bacterium]